MQDVGRPWALEYYSFSKLRDRVQASFELACSVLGPVETIPGHEMGTEDDDYFLECVRRRRGGGGREEEGGAALPVLRAPSAHNADWGLCCGWLEVTGHVWCCATPLKNLFSPTPGPAPTPPPPHPHAHLRHVDQW